MVYLIIFIKSITIMHMELPYCGGVGYIVEEALKQSGTELLFRDIIRIDQVLKLNKKL